MKDKIIAVVLITSIVFGTLFAVSYADIKELGTFNNLIKPDPNAEHRSNS